MPGRSRAERGRKIFFDAEKSLCIKCHRVGDQGERIGPELTGIGARFGRVYLIESILEPSRAVVPGFATVRAELSDNSLRRARSDATYPGQLKFMKLKPLYQRRLVSPLSHPSYARHSRAQRANLVTICVKLSGHSSINRKDGINFD